MSDAPERHDHWSVRVETSGEMIVQIETECLAGREPSAADEEAIRTAAHHLLAFIGDPHPVRADACLHGEALEEVRAALVDLARAYAACNGEDHPAYIRASADLAKIGGA
ncbi:hypothetical protein [Pseudogemmobacter sonorensis]|uniref:hypothetical protein n=1 Tax=Pseudogemmobacter sonorensis TaxID=2989681 RepID=UPI003679BC6E